jgi:hypothetical protein
VEIETSTGKQMVWVLIDLDASCEIGTPAGQKITSSAFYPPEMARQELMKQAPPTHAADLTAVAAEKQAQLDAAMRRREIEVVASLTSELKQLEAELKHVAGTAQAEPIHASIQFEMWYFGCLLYQLSTEDGMMLWDANQADNIDDRQLRQLAYQWADVKDDKLQKIIWPQAEHLASLLLSEHAQHRPSTWDQVMQHPFLAREGESAPLKRVVMSCPEWARSVRTAFPARTISRSWTRSQSCSRSATSSSGSIDKALRPQGSRTAQSLKKRLHYGRRARTTKR